LIRITKYYFVIIFLLGLITAAFPFIHDYFVWKQINLGTIDSLLILTGFIYILIGFIYYLIQKYYKKRFFKYQKTVVFIFYLISIAGIFLYSVSDSFKRNKWSLITYEVNKINTRKYMDKAYHKSRFTAKEVTDINADFIADPFTLKKNDNWYCFFEAGNTNSHKGEIGMSVSTNGIDWKYEKIVLKEPFHLSFPFVFKESGNIYMIPESSQDSSVRLYVSKDFPYSWKLDTILLKGKPFKDNIVFHKDNLWWLFTSTANDNLLLYYADYLKGPWKSHPQNPIKSNYPDGSRMAGKIFVKNDSVFRIAQDDYPNYGNNIRTFYINTMDINSYKEKEVELFPDFRALNSFSTNGVHSCAILETDSSYLIMVDGY